ncbi:hypothetical protein Clacol_001747 [Clathrus columnatus]|uniref:Uncharacterized protein n=1 Tax=Clathrus columnatus TaxID=1419009 RepID=A0AAV5A002_9AGAM|nr:hypothetical protein Clacol_001747 [Clathrus columnatus]
MSSVIHAAAGAAGGITAMTVTYTRAAVETNKTNKSTIQAVFEIIQKEGLLGLYAGVSSSLLGIAVTNGTREAILRWPTRKTKSKALSTIESMLSGLVAGLSSFPTPPSKD